MDEVAALAALRSAWTAQLAGPVWSARVELIKSLVSAEAEGRRCNEELLREVLAFAVEAVPYYRAFRARLSQTQSSTLAALRSFPVVNSGIIRGRLQQFAVTGAWVRGLEVRATSGTTGPPMIHLQSQDQELVYSCAVRGRLERRKGIGWRAEVLDLSPRLLDAAGCFVEPVVSMEYTGGDRLLWKLQRYCEHTPASVEEFRLFGMRQFDIIFGAPSRIDEYLNWATNLSFVPRPRLVVTTFEELTPAAASHFGSAFDAPVVNLYGATETGFIAASDQGAWPLRVEQDFAVVEVLKIDGDEPAMVGEVGRVVVTSLRSRVMPIIRYDVGDLVELVEEDDLGPGVARSLGRIVGRTSVTFVTRLGIKMGAGRVLDAMKALDVWPFQVVQRAAGQLMLRLDPSASKETADALCARLKADTPELFVDSFDLFFDDSPFEQTVAGKRLLAVQQMFRQ